MIIGEELNEKQKKILEFIKISSEELVESFCDKTFYKPNFSSSLPELMEIFMAVLSSFLARMLDGMESYCEHREKVFYKKEEMLRLINEVIIKTWKTTH